MNTNSVREDIISKWVEIYHSNDVCMLHLLSSDEAKELTKEEKENLLIYAGEDDWEDEMVMDVLNRG